MKIPPLLKNPLFIVNFVVMTVGTVASPLPLRLYYLRGGRSKWLTAWLQSAAFPLLLIPLFFSFLQRRRHAPPPAKPFVMSTRLFVASAGVGFLVGVDNFLYAYGLAFLPVSTAMLLLSTQLGFTAAFAWLLVKQRLTPFSLNAIVLLTAGAVILGVSAGGDRPEGVTAREYAAGFGMTVGAAALYGLVLPVLERSQMKYGAPAGGEVVVVEMQLVMGAVATLFCSVAMAINGDFQRMASEAANFELGRTGYWLVLAGAAILFQCFFVGTQGAIYYGSALLAGIIIAVLVPVTAALAVVAFHEPFDGSKGVALALSLWGFASYFYGEMLAMKKKKAEEEAAARDNDKLPPPPGADDEPPNP